MPGRHAEDLRVAVERLLQSLTVEVVVAVEPDPATPGRDLDRQTGGRANCHSARQIVLEVPRAQIDLVVEALPGIQIGLLHEERQAAGVDLSTDGGLGIDGSFAGVLRVIDEVGAEQRLHQRAVARRGPQLPPAERRSS